MSSLIKLGTAAGFLSLVGILAAQQEPAQKAGRRIVKPGPVVAAGSFELKVQTQPKFPNETRGEASTPAETDSLAVTIQPEKKSFAGNGPLAFLVTFENKADTPRMLFGLEHLGDSPKLVIANQDNANQWSLTGSFAQDKNPPAVELAAGQSKTYTLVVESQAVIVPRPIPLPRPVPRPLPLPIEKKGAQPENPKVPPQILPPRPPVVIGAPLPCGQGSCRAMLLLEFKTDPIRRYKHPTWTGKIASGTVDFQVGKPQPVAIPPFGGGPVTKDRAIQLAQAAAERALQSNYQPVPGVKPAHQGTWIENAEKTANVTEKKTGGWTVSWTHFPKSGFSYNVKIDVGTSGAAVVQEVFTSYSE